MAKKKITKKQAIDLIIQGAEALGWVVALPSNVDHTDKISKVTWMILGKEDVIKNFSRPFDD